MNETKPQLELTGLERFSHLEDKIFRIVEEFKAVRRDNELLRTENEQLKKQVETLHQNEAAARESLELLQMEREELRQRVEKALDLLASLEAK